MITLALSVATLKAFALFVGPDGMGFLALLQSILNLGVLVGTFGLSTALVTAIAGAASAGDCRRVAALRRAGNALGFMGAGIAGGLIAAGSQPLASFMFGDVTFAPAFFLIAAATACTVVAVVGTAEMTAVRRIGAVTAVGVGTAAAATVCGTSLVALFGIAGIPLALLVTAVVQLSATAILVGRAPEQSFHPPPEIIPMARRLLSLGAPVAASQLAGGGVALTVPILVAQLLTTHDVGLYRAASAVTVGYLAFFLAALTQDFLPRASGAAAAELAMLIERRMRLIIGLAAPLILGLLATAPWITRILYSDSFGQAVPVLQWQLVGDLIKLPAWVLSFVLLSRQSGQRYFIAEMAAGGTLLLATVVGIAAIGLVGAGVAYAITQVVYYITVWALVRRILPATPGRLQVVVLGVAAVCALLVSVALPDAIRLVAFGSAGLILAGLAWPRLYTLHSRGEL